MPSLLQRYFRVKRILLNSRHLPRLQRRGTAFNMAIPRTINKDKSFTLANTISMPLSYALSMLIQLLPLPFHVFKADDHYLEKFDNGASDSWNVLKNDFDFRKEILSQIRQKNIALISQERPVIYGGVKCNDELTLVIGPVVISDVDANFCKLYALKHQSENVSFLRCEPSKLAAVLLLIYSSLTGNLIGLNDFLDQNYLQKDFQDAAQKQTAKVLSYHTTQTTPHNPASFEEAIKDAIKSGDVEALRKALNSPYAGMRGTLSYNPLRAAQNLAVVDITIATRAAIEAGISAEESYILADAFILEVDSCKYPTDAAALSRACALRCTQLVAKLKKSMLNSSDLSSAVIKACAYIDRHLYEKINVQDLADKLKISSGYLVKLFKQERKQTVTEYIAMRKIEAAKIMLKATDKSIGDIAILLSFNSQSHFGRVFLAQTGMSPARFRKKLGSDLI